MCAFRKFFNELRPPDFGGRNFLMTLQGLYLIHY